MISMESTNSDDSMSSSKQEKGGGEMQGKMKQMESVLNIGGL